MVNNTLTFSITEQLLDEDFLCDFFSCETWTEETEGMLKIKILEN